MRYRENTPVVLNGLDFLIRPGEKLGIVGRTGSGEELFRPTDGLRFISNWNQKYCVLLVDYKETSAN